IIIPIGNTVSWNYCGRGYDGYDGYGQGYNRGYGYDNSNYSGLDRALSNLSDAFRYSDVKQLDRLLPSGGNVEVFIDGDYSYTLSSDDYYDITSDLILGVNTTNFQVVQVKRLRAGGYIAV